MEKHLKNELKTVSSSMFAKNFVGIFHGSISAKVEDDRFIINSRNSVFDCLNEDDFIELYAKKDYRWTNASIDADIHLKIYQNISEAKYVSYTMAPFMTSYALTHDIIKPKDYFGNQSIKELVVYDPKDYDSWYPRANDEIYRHLRETKSDMMIIKGYGLYCYSRDLTSLIKKIAILENSCKLLHRLDEVKGSRNFPLS
jgi:L-fuculose-phosphate aldolase